MTKPLPPLDSIKPDTPLRLDVAVRIAFPHGGMTVSGLRRELKRKSKHAGRRLIETIARKDFTTLRDIETMRELCRADQAESGFGSNPKNSMPAASGSVMPHGLSETDRARSAQAALKKTAHELKKRSPSTSRTNTASQESATVIPLRSSF
jgi:hypothetical protein